MHTKADEVAKFNDLKAALGRGARVVAGLNSFDGSASIPAFEAKYAGDTAYLFYSQTRIFEKGVRYVTRTRLGSN